MSKDPFELNIGKPINVEWESGKHLDYDESSQLREYQLENVPKSRRQTVFLILLISLIGVTTIFLARLLDLEILNGETHLSRAEGNRLRVQYLKAPRGVIYDRFGIAIAENEASFELILTTLDLPEDENRLDEVVEMVSGFFGIKKEEIEKIITESSKDSYLPVTVSTNIEKEKAIAFIASEKKYPGFTIQNNPQRQYLKGPIYSHVLGYTGKLSEEQYREVSNDGYLYNDIIGKSGLEKYYEDNLRGVFGQKLVEVDASGNVKNTFQEKESVQGKNLHLHLDAELQEVLYSSLLKQLEIHRASRAAAVVIDPKTGGVLALVSLPSYDNNAFARGISSQYYESLTSNQNLPMFNRAISGTYPPGSTVKPMIAAGALEEGVIDKKTRILDTGALQVPNQYNPEIIHTFRGWNPAGLGNVNIYEAIAESSDIYFYTIGGGQADYDIEGLGVDGISKYLKEFYLGKSTGIDLPGEQTGLVPTREWKAERFSGNQVERLWFLGDTYNMSIGQGFNLATPLQIAVATAAIANNGFVLRPKLVKEITDETGSLTEVFAPEVLNYGFLSEDNIKVAQEGMRLAVTDGTAKTLADLPIDIAGKTGTSQFDGSDLSRTHAWFTSYAPYKDPEIVVTVLVEAGGEGSGVAVPVASEVYNWYAKNRQH